MLPDRKVPPRRHITYHYHRNNYNIELVAVWTGKERTPDAISQSFDSIKEKNISLLNYMSGNTYNDLISVVIPLFNAENFLQPLMDSIVLQTYTNYEVIFVDDGSQDNSVQVVRNQIAKDNRFRLLLRPEDQIKGAPTCRNIGMREAKGEYIIFFDADDIIADYCFEQRVKSIKESGKDFCVFPIMAFGNTPFDMDKPSVGAIPTGIDILYGMIARLFPFLVVTNIYKKVSLIEHNIEWDARLKSLQDSDFNFTCILSGMTFSIEDTLPDYYVRLRGNDGSISKRIAKKSHIESHLYLFEKEYALCRGKGYDSAFYGFLYYLMGLFLQGDNKETIRDFLSNSFLKDHVTIGLRMKLYYYLFGNLVRQNKKIARIVRMVLFPIYEYTYWITSKKLNADKDKYIAKHVEWLSRQLH